MKQLDTASFESVFMFWQLSWEEKERAFLFLGKTFQNRKVSSPAPVTMVSESGDMAR